MAPSNQYGVATIRRLLEIIGLFYKRDDVLQKRPVIIRSLPNAAAPPMGWLRLGGSLKL